MIVSQTCPFASQRCGCQRRVTSPKLVLQEEPTADGSIVLLQGKNNNRLCLLSTLRESIFVRPLEQLPHANQ